MVDRIIKSAKRSFVKRVGSVVDMGATYHKSARRTSKRKSDSDALKSDWIQTGADISAAIVTFESEKNVK